MTKKAETTRIVLLCDNVSRELSYLLLLKDSLEKSPKTKVYIIGSVAEIQRTYYYINSIKPHVVVVSQIVEDSMRELAAYVRKSGALLFVLPPEVLVIPALTLIFSNPNIAYDHLLDAILLPGHRLKEVFKKTDISNNKLVVVGTPKVDVLLNEYGDQFFSREKFLKHLKAPTGNKNIIIFTSFITIPVPYMRSNQSFKNIEKKLSSNNHFVEEARIKYVQAVSKLCEDFPNFNIILKPHPLEKNVDVNYIQHPNFYIASDVSFYNCINSIDIAIHWSSTIAPECWLKRIKTIQFLPHKYFKHRIVESWPGNPMVNSYESLKDAIIKYERSKIEKHYRLFQNSYLKGNFFKLDGKSCLRISNFVTKMKSKRDIVLNYDGGYPVGVQILLLLEKITGVLVSRIILKIFLPKYKWRYAVNNHVLIGL